MGERLGLPAPVLMTLAGIVLALLPFVPNVEIPPDYILPLVLPPLLYASVQRTSWRQFTANMRPIFLLAVALVLRYHRRRRGGRQRDRARAADRRRHRARGARRAARPGGRDRRGGALGLPRRLVSILEGEGLFNDVTAIVLYHVAIAAAVSGTFSLAAGRGRARALRGGGRRRRARARLGRQQADGAARRRHAADRADLLVPFVVVRTRRGAHGRGCSPCSPRRSSSPSTPPTPTTSWGGSPGTTFWEIVDTLVTGVAFGLIGLELHNAIGTADGPLGRSCSAGRRRSSAVVVGVRLLWLLPATWLAKRLHKLRDYDEEIPTTWRETVVMWWSGMRGVASVALALAIPLKTDDGAPFPARDEIIFIAFGVIMATLVVQGLTLPWLVKRLGVRADTEVERGLEQALAIRAAKAAKRAAQGDRGGRGAAGGRRGAAACAGRTTSGRGSAPTWSTRSGASWYGEAGRAAQAGPAHPARDDVRGPARGARRAQRAGRRPRDRGPGAAAARRPQPSLTGADGCRRALAGADRSRSGVRRRVRGRGQPRPVRAPPRPGPRGAGRPGAGGARAVLILGSAYGWWSAQPADQLLAHRAPAPSRCRPRPSP